MGAGPGAWDPFPKASKLLRVRSQRQGLFPASSEASCRLPVPETMRPSQRPQALSPVSKREAYGPGKCIYDQAELEGMETLVQMSPEAGNPGSTVGAPLVGQALWLASSSPPPTPLQATPEFCFPDLGVWHSVARAPPSRVSLPVLPRPQARPQAQDAKQNSVPG